MITGDLFKIPKPKDEEVWPFRGCLYPMNALHVILKSLRNYRVVVVMEGRGTLKIDSTIHFYEKQLRQMEDWLAARSLKKWQATYRFDYVMSMSNKLLNAQNAP